MTDNPATESGALVWVEMVAAKFATSHTADRVDKVGPIEIFEAVLVRIVCVGTAVKVIGRRILPTLLVTCILRTNSVHMLRWTQGTYAVTLFVEHEGSDSPPSVGAVPGLALDTNSGAAPAVLVLGSRDGTSGHWHGRRKWW